MAFFHHWEAISPRGGPLGRDPCSKCAPQPQTTKHKRQRRALLRHVVAHCGERSSHWHKHDLILSSCRVACSRTASGLITLRKQVARAVVQWRSNNQTDCKSGINGMRCKTVAWCSATDYKCNNERRVLRERSLLDDRREPLTLSTFGPLGSPPEESCPSPHTQEVSCWQHSKLVSCHC